MQIMVARPIISPKPIPQLKFNAYHVQVWLDVKLMVVLLMLKISAQLVTPLLDGLMLTPIKFVRPVPPVVLPVVPNTSFQMLEPVPYIQILPHKLTARPGLQLHAQPVMTDSI